MLYAYSILAKIAEIKVAQVWSSLGAADRARHYVQRFFSAHKEDYFEGLTLEAARITMEKDHLVEFCAMRTKITSEYAASAINLKLFLQVSRAPAVVLPPCQRAPQLGPQFLLYPEFDARDIKGGISNRPALTLAYSLLGGIQPRDETVDRDRESDSAHPLSFLQLPAQHALLSILRAIAGREIRDYVARFLESMRDELHAAIPPYPYKESVVIDDDENAPEDEEAADTESSVSYPVIV